MDDLDAIEPVTAVEDEVLQRLTAAESALKAVLEDIDGAGAQLGTPAIGKVLDYARDAGWATDDYLADLAVLESA